MLINRVAVGVEVVPLAAGVHPKVVQERLVHSPISLTLDVYSHVLPSMQLEPASRLDAAMRGA